MTQDYSTHYIRFEDSVSRMQTPGSESLLPSHREGEQYEIQHNDDLSPEPTTQSMIIHRVASNDTRKWSHIEDLDDFFKRIYNYHQNSGMLTLCLKYFSQVLISLVTICLVILLLVVFNYPILFAKETVELEDGNDVHENKTYVVSRKTLNDCFYSYDEITENTHFFTGTFLICILSYWFANLVYSLYDIGKYFDIKSFYNQALNIKDSELMDYKWEEVQSIILDVQHVYQMCIHNLSELDITHRILRFENYFIAMVNRDLIQVKFNAPVFGEMVFLTDYMIQFYYFMFFKGPFAVFKNNWHVMDEYRNHDRRLEMANQLRKDMLRSALVAFIASPFVLIYKLFMVFFNYADYLRKEPSIFTVRTWSFYARTYLRHYNELDHELNARLCRAYRSANTYINSFTSPTLTHLVSPFAFMFGATGIIFVVLSAWDVNVIEIQHVSLILALGAAGFAIGRAVTPNEYIAWYPELLMQRVLYEVHYLPDAWKGKAHTTHVRNEFSKLFQYRFSYIIEEFLSCVFLPIYIAFCMSKRSLDFVDFFRNFTVDVTGVGHVCSFAMMDVKKHGNPIWHPNISELLENDFGLLSTDPHPKTDFGRTERSLLHFTLRNPRWQPPEASSNYLQSIQKRCEKDCTSVKNDDQGNLDEEKLGHSLALSLTELPIQQLNVDSNIGPTGHHMSTNTSPSKKPPVTADFLEATSSISNRNQQFQSQEVADLNDSPYIMDHEMRLSMMYLNNIHYRNKERNIYTDTPRDFELSGLNNPQYTVPEYQEYHSDSTQHNQGHPSFRDSGASQHPGSGRHKETTPLLKH